jgi:hypothetical protein
MSQLPAGIECGDSESCSALSIHGALFSFDHRFTEGEQKGDAAHLCSMDKDQDIG